MVCPSENWQPGRSEVTSNPKSLFYLPIARLDGYFIAIREEEQGGLLRVTVTNRHGAWTGTAEGIDAALDLTTKIIFEHPVPLPSEKRT